MICLVLIEKYHDESTADSKLVLNCQMLFGITYYFIFASKAVNSLVIILVDCCPLWALTRKGSEKKIGVYKYV